MPRLRLPPSRGPRTRPPRLVPRRPRVRRSVRGGVRGGELRLVLLAGALAGLVLAELPRGVANVPSLAVTGLRGAPRVIDGDTFDYRGDRIRIAGIDTPETHPPRCPREAALGARATERLEELLAQPFTLTPIDRDEDVYGRKLRHVRLADGRDAGTVLIAEGLARPYAGGRRPWCG